MVLYLNYNNVTQTLSTLLPLADRKINQSVPGLLSWLQNTDFLLKLWRFFTYTVKSYCDGITLSIEMLRCAVFFVRSCFGDDFFNILFPYTINKVFCAVLTSRLLFLITILVLFLIKILHSK